MTIMRPISWHRLLLVALIQGGMVVCPGEGWGALSPATKEYPIVGELTGHQQQPQLAFGNEGGFMVWLHESGQSGSFPQLAVQRLNKGMLGVGLAVSLSKSPDGTREAHPSIALLADGGAVVVWEAGPLSNRDVKIRFLSSSGIFTSAVITVNGRTDGDQYQPAVTVLSGGGVVVAWTSAGQDSSSNGVYGQHLTSAGAKVGGEPALAALADGRYTAIWISESINGETTHGAPNLKGNLMGRLFHANGRPVAHEYRINHVDAMCSRPVVEAFGEGFVVAWEQQDEQVMSNSTDIFIRSFDRAGLPLAQEVRWNALVGGGQKNPAFAVSQGTALLVWECDVKVTNSREVHARMLSGGAEFRVNQHVSYNQYQPTVGAAGWGNYVVAWVDYVKPRNSTLTAMQFNLSGNADVTSGKHVSYDGPGTAPLVLGAKTSAPKDDPVAAELLHRNFVQQLAVEFSADEQSRQAALIAQSAAAVKASELLQQMATETQEPVVTAASDMIIRGSNVGSSSIENGLENTQVGTGTSLSNRLSPKANNPINSSTVGMTVLSSEAQASIFGNRAFTPQSTIRRRSTLSRERSLSGNINSRRRSFRGLPLNMQRSLGNAMSQSERSLFSRLSNNIQRSISQGSSLRQAQGTITARRLSSTGLATLRSQGTGGSRSMATATSRLNATRSQRMPTQTQAQQSRASSHVNASLVRGGTDYKLQWSSRAGSRYQVQRSRDSNSWVNDGPVKRGTGRQINAPVSASGEYRYYRVIKSQ